jgi:hypothetical protein
MSLALRRSATPVIAGNAKHPVLTGNLSFGRRSSDD